MIRTVRSKVNDWKRLFLFDRPLLDRIEQASTTWHTTPSSTQIEDSTHGPHLATHTSWTGTPRPLPTARTCLRGSAMAGVLLPVTAVIGPTYGYVLHEHYQNLALCRVPYSLPSVFFQALGKESLCRVPRKKPSVKENTRRRSSLPGVLFLTLSKEFLCRVSFFDTRQRALCRVSQIQHSAKSSLPSVFFQH
jgi:hypothetical protein